MKEEIKKFFKGEVFDDEETLLKYSHDASLLEVKPSLVVYPKDSSDLENLTKFVNEKKKTDKDISLTVRSAGSCMSGGSLNESIIADVTKYINKVGEIKEEGTMVEPGMFYRDFEVLTLEKSLILPCFTASKNLCALGGMIGNNAAGERTLAYGKMEDYVLESDVVFSDGNKYKVRPLNKTELETKISQNDFEGNIYKKVFNLIKNNEEIIKPAKPKVSKNSAGYYIWNVWDGNTFNLNKLIVGSQGTLGIVTDAKIKLVPIKKKSKLFVIFMKDLENLSELVNEILPFKPDSIESYDDATLKLAFRFFPEMLKTMKMKNFFKLIFSFWPEALMILKGGIPKLVVLVEFANDDESVIDLQMIKLEEKIAHFKFKTRKPVSEEESKKYWTIRRESFNLLRKHIKGKRTAPFVDDVVVLPEHLPEFLPKMIKILDKYKLTYTVAGHAGNGNFHIIPLMDMRDHKNIEIIKEVSEEVYNLVASYKGSITAEHNDGIIRTPYLPKMYDPRIIDLFEEIKNIFDPQNIFNPGKKVHGTLDYMISHIVKK